MRAEKIKSVIGDYLYDFWLAQKQSKVHEARLLLKQTLEEVEIDNGTRYKLTAEYYLLCRLDGVDTDLGSASADRETK